jgi:hypothetical protein
VQNFFAEGTGDDALAFFNASGRVSNATISGSFARGILLFNSDIALSDLHMDASPVLRR